MSLPVQTIVGGVAAAAAGSQPQSLRVGPTAESIVQELHGRYYETTVRKANFSGANTAAVALTAGFATTYTGLCLSNPLGSQVNGVINKAAWSALVAQAAAIGLGLMTGFHASTNVVHTTPIVSLSNFAGQPTGTLLLDAAATLPIAPTRVKLLDSLLTGAITTSTNGGKIVDLEGGMIIPPGGFVAFWGSAASTAASLLFGLDWEEVSITI